MAKVTDFGYIGTEFKFVLDIQADGFSMETDDFNVVLKRGGKSLKLEKEDLVEDEHGVFYVCFDSAELGKGNIVAIITAYVPDDDFEDGFRTEVMKIDLITVKAV